MIRVLPAEVVNQIAAGEVVERPFSVVKELCENSLDAGARRLRIELQDGGRAAIRVLDDGAGIAESDLPLAFEGHATSKLAELRDLEHIASLGFRGEALASIGSVSRARIQSRTRDGSAGFEVECVGGAVGAVRPCGCPPGTLVEVRDLFFNTPARRRFLRTPQAERARVHELVLRLALARVDVAFTLQSDGHELLSLPAGQSLRERFAAAFGARAAGNLVEVAREWGGYRLDGLCGEPELARRDATLELLYVNGRHARDRAAVQAVRQAYRPYLMGGRLPVYCLLLSLPPDQVDVNVHPTKSEVRFLESRRVAGLLHDAVAAALAGRGVRTSGSAAVPPLWVGEGRPAAASGFPELPRDLFARPVSPPTRAPMARGERRDAPPDPAAPNPFARAAGARFLQVMDLYIVLGTDGGLVIVDQHALHERVLYERLVRQHAARGEPRVQRLLVPDVVELAPRDKAWLLESRDALAAEGFLVEDFGGGSIAVHGVPAVLGRSDPRALVETFLCGDDDGEARPRARDAIVERFHSMACRAAVMSGDRLTDTEIEALLEEARGLEHPHNCPHGRPTVLTFPPAELERYFRRRV